MGANPTQAFGFTVMILAFVCLGLAFAGGGVLAGAGAVVLLVISGFLFNKCKPWEHEKDKANGSMSAMAAKEAKG